MADTPTVRLVSLKHIPRFGIRLGQKNVSDDWRKTGLGREYSQRWQQEPLC